jgi:aspartate racemase
MKTLGIIGGLSWESTIEYYKRLNEGVLASLGGVASAPLVLSSVNFQPYADLMASGNWDRIRENLVAEAARLGAAGVDGILIATNTMHVFADEVEAAAGVPLLHIADSVARPIRASGFTKVGFLGTRYSMEKDFIRGRLSSRFGIETIVPGPDERGKLNDIIFGELCRGVFEPGSRNFILGLVALLQAEGARGVVLGCTELPLVVHAGDTALPVWDTIETHVAAALDFILG